MREPISPAFFETMADILLKTILDHMLDAQRFGADPSDYSTLNAATSRLTAQGMCHALVILSIRTPFEKGAQFWHDVYFNTKYLEV